MTPHLVCALLYLPSWLPVGSPQGQGEQVTGREWETEAKVRTEDYLVLSALPT